MGGASPVLHLAGELLEDFSGAAVVLQLGLNQCRQLAHLLDLQHTHTHTHQCYRTMLGQSLAWHSTAPDCCSLFFHHKLFGVNWNQGFCFDDQKAVCSTFSRQKVKRLLKPKNLMASFIQTSDQRRRRLSVGSYIALQQVEHALLCNLFALVELLQRLFDLIVLDLPLALLLVVKVQAAALHLL